MLDGLNEANCERGRVAFVEKCAATRYNSHVCAGNKSDRDELLRLKSHHCFSSLNYMINECTSVHKLNGI